MKKTVLTFGLIAGVIISVLMGGSLLLANKIGSGHSMAARLHHHGGVVPARSTSASAATATTPSPAKSPSAAPSPAAS